MQTAATTSEEYLNSLPTGRKKPVQDLRKVILENLPEGFTEETGNGMLAYVVPCSLYPSGYHCKPPQPLPFMNLASQKNFIALYHMGLYADKKLLQWFTEAYPAYSERKLDMGKSCIRFKKMDDIPLDLVGQLASKMTPQEWISLYEEHVRR